MKVVILCLACAVAFVSSAPLYGDEGVYTGYASYVAPKGAQSKTDSFEDSIDSSAGSPDVSRQTSDSYEDASKYDVPPTLPKKLHRHRPSRPSPADSSSHEQPDTVPDRINLYLPSRSSAEDASGYKEPNYVVPKRFNRRQPSRPAQVTSAYVPKPLPKKYDVTDYSPKIQHGYGGTKLAEDKPRAPYHRATLYGQEDGGYKINQHVDGHVDSEDDYKGGHAVLKNSYNDDDHISHQPQPYEFGYQLKDKHGNTQHRHETSDGHGSVKGTYGYTDEHGLYRSVQYVADKGGFRASIMTNEPGTENEDPADVKIKVDKKDY